MIVAGRAGEPRLAVLDPRNPDAPSVLETPVDKTHATGTQADVAAGAYGTFHLDLAAWAER
jgi:hypothetical protein